MAGLIVALALLVALIFIATREQKMESQEKDDDRHSEEHLEKQSEAKAVPTTFQIRARGRFIPPSVSKE